MIYNVGISFYASAVKLAALKNSKAQKMTEGHKQVFDYLRENRKPEDRYLWFHAASLGEFEQGRPMIEEIRKSHPEYKILLTFFSPSGYEVRKNYEGADLICYLPFDEPSRVKRFLDLVRPEKAFFIKYEFWANYLLGLKSRGIPVYLISAIFRPDQIFFKGYGQFFRNLLPLYEHIFVQDESSYALLRNIGVKKVSVSGDTRFDRVREIMKGAKELPLVEKFVKDTPLTLVAGSSWPKDEDILIDYFNNRPDMKLIIAPHEIHESHIRDIIRKLNMPYVRYTELTDEVPADARCLIIDCIGMLSSVYRYGKLAYIGGGFGVGIHNVLEAAVYDIPVVFGPNYQKFREAKELIAAKGAFSIANAAEFKALMAQFEQEQAFLKSAGDTAGYYVAHNSGATSHILEAVF
ncbi:MAG: glycosyltransferase N-terminal domain-containing protein [Bacteroidales bacterium]